MLRIDTRILQNGNSHTKGTKSFTGDWDTKSLLQILIRGLFLNILPRALAFSGIRHPKATVDDGLGSKAIVPMRHDQIENTPS